MRVKISDAFRRMNSRELQSDEAVHSQAVGFYAGLALAQLDPILATSIHIELMREWSLDSATPIVYGPSEMARHLIREIGQSGV